MSDNAAPIADRRRQWAELWRTQQMQRVQYTLIEFQDYAALRRHQRQRSGTRQRERDHER